MAKTERNYGLSLLKVLMCFEVLCCHFLSSATTPIWRLPLALLKTSAESGLEVEQVFQRANDKLCQGNDAGMFVTAWMGILELSTGRLTYADAGHNPPLLRRREGQFEYLRVKPNFVLAGMEGIRYRRHEMQLEPGDTLYLYTDGVTEAANAANELYGEERLEQVLNEQTGTPQALCTDVRAHIDAFVQGAEQSDDITMLCVTWYGAEAER